MVNKDTSPKSTEKVSRREELRKQREAEARKASRRKLIAILVVAGVLLASTIMGTILAMNSGKAKTPQVAVPNAVETHGIAYKTAKAPKADALTVEVFQDFQCPGCGIMEKTFGSYFEQLANDGDIKLQFNTLTFLDYVNKDYNQKSSTRSAIAAACSDVVGKHNEYHDEVYANQPQTEGIGYSEDQLRVQFPKNVGITGDNLVKFQQCYDTKATQNFVTKVTDYAGEKGISQTPTYLVNGEQLNTKAMVSVRDKESLLAFLKNGQ